MKGFFETLFLTLALAWAGWLVITAGVKVEMKFMGDIYGVQIGGANEQQRQELIFITRKNIAKENVFYQAALLGRTDSLFLIQHFFPSLDRLFYDSVYVYRLKSPSTYSVTGGTYLVFYRSLNFNSHETIFSYNDAELDSSFYAMLNQVASD